MTPTGTELRSPRRPGRSRPPGPSRVAARSPRFLLPVLAAVLVAVGLVVLVATAGRGPSGTPAQQLRSWATATDLGPTLGILSADAHNVDRALAAHQGTNALHTVCAVLYTEAEKANQNLPSPDTDVTQTLSRAFTLAYDAGQACYRGAGGDHSLMAQSAHDRTRALHLLRQVTDRVARVTGRPLSTTTTTGPGGPTSTFL